MNVSLTQGLHRALQQTPRGVATVCGARRRTFAELADRVARLAGALRGLGVAPDDRVGMLALNGDRYLEYYLGVFWAGAIVNPCNTRWSSAEIAYSLEDCATRVLLVDDAFVSMVAELRARAPSLATVVYAGDGAAPDGMLSYEQLLAAATPVDDARRGADDVSGVFYTGGTTGYPKGVELTHGSIFASSMSLAAEVPSPAGVYLHAAPMFHMADAAAGMLHVIRGSTHVFVPRFTPADTLETIQRTKVTATLIVPTMIQMMVDHPEIGRYDLSSLRAVLYGASAISEAVLKRAMAVLPHVGFTQAYGMTELSPVATVLPAERHAVDGPLAGKLRSAGRAALCSEVRIVDADDREVPLGTVGEVVVRGPHVMKGYWNKPELTAEALRNGWMHTGDGGYMDDEGFVFIVDRIKDMIVSGGENVYSAEVENALMQHAGVAMCAVIAVPDARWGERVHAVVVARAGHAVTADELVAHCHTLIANYKCPRSVELRSELPISGAGKILKKDLREAYWKGVARRVG